MSKLANRWSLFGMIVLLFANAAVTVFGQQRDAVLWEPVKISSRNLMLGRGGSSMRPNTRRITFIEQEKGGNNLKYRIKDGSGRVWVAKIADESQAEVAANRLLWAIGYKTEIDYLVPRLTIPTKKTYVNVRLEARPANVERDGRWAWKENPFVGTKEFSGLKLMMALINNWDLKDDNTGILKHNGRVEYVVSDLGSSFGRTAATSLPIFTKFGRSVNNPHHYAGASFIVGMSDKGYLDLAYDGKQDHLMKEFTIEDARWLGNLLRQLSAKQISDAFRAANYDRSEVKLLTDAFRRRVAELNSPSRAIAERRIRG
jgi:hypothetical protein